MLLGADEGERAKRRSAERPGVGADDLARDLRVRDASDSAQTLKDDEALEIDTTSLTVDQVVDLVEERVRALQRA